MAEISAREPQAAELECIAEPGLRRPALIDGSKIIWAEHMVTQDLGFRLRQCQSVHPSVFWDWKFAVAFHMPFKNYLPYKAILKEDCERNFILICQRDR